MPTKYYSPEAKRIVKLYNVNRPNNKLPIIKRLPLWNRGLKDLFRVLQPWRKPRSHNLPFPRPLLWPLSRTDGLTAEGDLDLFWVLLV
jgi:hypothetical protein